MVAVVYFKDGTSVTLLDVTNVRVEPESPENKNGRWMIAFLDEAGHVVKRYPVETVPRYTLDQDAMAPRSPRGLRPEA